MHDFTRGQKGKLSDLGLGTVFPVTCELAAGELEIDVICFGLDASGKLADERFMVFYNQKNAPADAIVLQAGGSKSVFQIDLAGLPESIDKLVFTAAISNQGSMRTLGASAVSLGHDALRFSFSGADFQDEKALLLGELYRRDGSWRFGAVGQGFNGALAALLKHFGGSESMPAPAAEMKKISLSKIRLEKRGDRVSLDKRDSNGYGRIRVNLNWNQGSQPASGQQPEAGGFISKLFGKPSHRSNGIDLDIGCMFEMVDGTKSAVQALGNSWGAYDRPPYIHLEADDRTGTISDGENLFINGAHLDRIKRVLIYAFIYQGVPNWAATDAMVTIHIPGQPAVEVKLDNGNNLSMCAIAMLDHQGGNLQVTKLVEYFGSAGTLSAHKAMDTRFGFGLNWTPGRKD